MSKLSDYDYWVDLQKAHGLCVSGYDVWKKSCVDIVIPVYGALDEVVKCTKAIKVSTCHPHTLILVNDKPKDEKAVKKLATKRGAKFIGHSKQMGFPKSCNDGWRLGTSPYVCFLNTDTIPAPRWLDRLAAHMVANHNVGIVGPTTSQGGSCQALLRYHKGRDTRTYRDVCKIGLEVESMFGLSCKKMRNVCGACYFTKRKLLERFNGFDEIYGLGYGEENDFELKVRKLKLISVWVKGAYVNHVGGVSFCSIDRKVLKSLRGKNTRRYNKRKRKSGNLDCV